jgi:hypothetical protein
MRFPSLASARRPVQASQAEASLASTAGRQASPFGQDGPGYAPQLVRQRYAGKIVMGARRKLCQPRTQTGRLLFSKL